MTKFKNGNILRVMARRLLPLLRMPAFWVITLFGNGFVGFGAVLLYYLENAYHAKPMTLLDSLSWAVGLVTTIGYGDLIPVTTAGKVLGIIMMIGGTLFLWSYMALLVGALLSPDISVIEQGIEGIKRESNIDDKKLNDVMTKLDQLQRAIDELKSNQKKI